MLISVPLGSSALISETWPGHCTAWMAYLHISNILGFPWWKQCTALMPHPLLLAKNPPSGPSRRSIPLPLGIEWLPVSGEVDWSLFGSGIELTKVNAKARTSIFLAHQYNCITPWALWALTGTDGSHFQCLLHVYLDLIHHGWGNPFELLFKGFIINNSDFMFLLGQYSLVLQAPMRKFHGTQLVRCRRSLGLPETTPLGQTSLVVGGTLLSSFQLTS